MRDHPFELMGLARREQYKVAPLVPGAAGAPAPVDERFQVLRHAVLDDVAHGVDVEAAGGDVGRYEYRDPAAAQSRERVVALALAHVAVYRRRAESVVAQPVRYILSLGLGAAENQRPARILPNEHVGESLEAFTRGYDIGALRDFAVRRDIRYERYFLRRVEIVFRKR